VKLPNLKHLDERPVFDEERRRAEAWGRGGREAELEERKKIDEERRSFHKEHVRNL
jgi:dynein assembly factor 1